MIEPSKNFIIVMLSCHGSDGIIPDSRSRYDPRMIVNMEKYIQEKIAHIYTKSRSGIKLVDDNKLEIMTDVLLDNEKLKNASDVVMQNKIQEQMCKLFISQIVSESGVCPYLSNQKMLNFKLSDIEIMLINSYKLYSQIKDDSRSIFGKFKAVLDELKRLYIKIIPSGTIHPEDRKQNEILMETDGLFRVFCPDVFKRDKIFQFFGNPDEIHNSTHFSQHYGIHVVDFNHNELSDLNYSVIPEEYQQESFRNYGEENPYTYPVKQLDVYQSIDIDNLTPNQAFNTPLTPFQRGVVLCRNIPETFPVRNEFCEPYNLKYQKNQDIFKQILWTRRQKDIIPENHFQFGIRILNKLTINIHVCLSEIWMLFDVLGFENIYFIDTSCRELEKEISTHTTRTGLGYGKTTVMVPSFGFEDPYAWEICGQDPGLRSTRSEKFKIASRNQSLASTIRKGGKTRKNKNKNKSRKNKNKKGKKQKKVKIIIK